MNNNFSYHMPTKIIYGNNEIKNIDKYINGRKTLLITSQGFVKRGLVEQILLWTNTIVKVVDNIKSHPEFKDLKVIYDDIKNLDFELILAIGGGSALDGAKFLSVQNENKDSNFVENLIKTKPLNSKYNLIPIIAIPTTAGTGSEITPWATIWDMEEKKKYSLHLPNLFSEIALYDPILTLSVPKDITITTGIDALSHALESVWNRNASPITVNYAINSSKLILNNLAQLSNDLENITYRDNVMKACMYAGLAFSNTQTAISHSMSYYITAYHNIDHGIACSFTLPMLIDSIIGKYDFIDKAILEIFGELSSVKLRDMFAKLNISTNFTDYGTTKEKVLHNLDNKRIHNSLILKEFIV